MAWASELKSFFFYKGWPNAVLTLRRTDTFSPLLQKKIKLLYLTLWRHWQLSSNTELKGKTARFKSLVHYSTPECSPFIFDLLSCHSYPCFATGVFLRIHSVSNEPVVTITEIKPIKHALEYWYHLGVWSKSFYSFNCLIWLTTGVQSVTTQ